MPLVVERYLLQGALSCQRGGSPEDHGDADSGDYMLIVDAVGSSGESDWRACNKCQGLYFAANHGSVCPDGSEHDPGASGDCSLLARR